METIFVGVASVKPIFENILSKSKQKSTVARYQTCYTNSTDSVKVVYMKVSGRTSSILAKCQILDSGKTLHTLQEQHQQQAYLLPESFTILDSKQSFKLCPIVAFFCSTSTQTVLTHMVGITEYKGQLNLKLSTAKRHIKTTLLHPTYSLLTAEFIHQDVITI